MLSSEKSEQSIDVNVITQYSDHIPDFYRRFECGDTYVPEMLEDELPYWKSRNPVMIVAGTGKRKTTFVYEKVIPRAIEQGKNVLLVGNRTALLTQMKQALAEIVGFEEFAWLNEIGQQKIEIMGPVAAITYHRLPAFLNDPKNKGWLENVGYMVADEAHFFAADSSFNEKCGFFLKLLTRNFCKAVRIYMTATPWDIYYPLAEAEKRNSNRREEYFQPWQPSRAFYLYHFTADYHHVNLKFFDHLKEIKEMIEESSEKWLVFVDNKTKGAEFANGLGDRAIYLDADNKQSEDWHCLLKESRFDSQVLVTTAVLDCGVNIIDPALRSIVIVSDNRTSLLQMLGRKRHKPGERVNLYVCDISMKKISSRQQDCAELCEWYDRYLNSTDVERKAMARELWHEPREMLRHYFDLTTNGYLVPNRIAFFALERRRRFYEKIQSGATTFRQEVQCWLGLEAEPEADPEEQLLRFCEANLDRELDEDEIMPLRKLIVATAKCYGYIEQQPRRVDSLGREALNNRLAYFNCPFELAKTAWTIQKSSG